jgi:hypothetical protein
MYLEQQVYILSIYGAPKNITSVSGDFANLKVLLVQFLKNIHIEQSQHMFCERACLYYYTSI